jgi:putative ABC transport system permease protein
VAHRPDAAGDIPEDTITMALKAVCKSLLHAPLGPFLLAAQVALSMVILANVAYIVSIRLEHTNRPTGLDLENIFWIWSEGHGTHYDQQSTTRFDLEYLNLLPGVIAASAASSVPQTFDAQETIVSGTMDFKSTRDVLLYQMTDRAVEALGLRLVAGREFAKDSVAPAGSGPGDDGTTFGQEVVITAALAERLFGSSQTAIGKTLFFSMGKGRSAAIVGVVERLQAAPFFVPGTNFVNEVVLVPAVPVGPTTFYIVRAQPGLRDQLMNRVVKGFESRQPDRYISRVTSLAETASEARAEDRATAVVLACLASLVLAVTMLGLFGFAAFAVASRTKEIGTRRAIGATRADVAKQFLQENWLITSAGIVVGIVITLIFALQLSMLLELPRLPARFLVGSMISIWMAGLLAALLPVLRGANVPPVVATRA